MPRVHDVALVFEGGGMRASYTSAMASLLMEQGIGFDYVCGISAGSSNTVNFVSGDVKRTNISFTDFVLDPRFGGVKTWLQGKGLFSAKWIYQEAGKPEGPFPFDYASFAADPAEVGIQAFDRDTGETVVWGKKDMPSLGDTLIRVQASSSLPRAMPPVTIGGHVFYDGGLGEGAGIPIHMAEEAGYERMLVVLTRPRGYRKSAPGRLDRAIANSFWGHPHVKKALLSRPDRYNAELDRLEELAKRGQACVVYADKMAVSSGTTDYEALVRSHADGAEQAERELPRVREFLGL